MNGDEVWSNSFSSSYSASGYCIQQTIDGGYIITGNNSIPSDQNVFLLKTDENGNQVWSNSFGGDENDTGYSVQQTLDGGFIITGTTQSYGAGGVDIWLLKIAPDFIPNFSCNTNFGYSSLDVNFTDNTYFAPTGWNWDFQNDGVIDSYNQNPTFLYNQAGIYDVKLIVERGTRSDTLIKESLIIVQESQLLPPQNPLITISGSDVILNWDTVNNANHYLIYSSDNPCGEFVFLDYTANTTYVNSEIISEKDKFFYFVIGFDGTMEDITRFINNNQRRSFNAETK